MSNIVECQKQWKMDSLRLKWRETRRYDWLVTWLKEEQTTISRISREIPRNSVNIPLSDPINWSNIARIWSRAVIVTKMIFVYKDKYHNLEKSKTIKNDMYICRRRCADGAWSTNVECFDVHMSVAFVHRHTFASFYCFKVPWLCFFAQTYGGGLTNDNWQSKFNEN